MGNAEIAGRLRVLGQALDKAIRNESPLVDKLLLHYHQAEAELFKLPETGEAPYWFLPDGRPVYREALIAKWRARGSPVIPLRNMQDLHHLDTWLDPNSESYINLEKLGQAVNFITRGEE